MYITNDDKHNACSFCRSKFLVEKFRHFKIEPINHDLSRINNFKANLSSFKSFIKIRGQGFQCSKCTYRTTIPEEIQSPGGRYEICCRQRTSDSPHQLTSNSSQGCAATFLTSTKKTSNQSKYGLANIRIFLEKSADN